MTLLLRRSSAQARIEGWGPNIWGEDDYAVVDDTIVGRIYREMIIGKPKWRWFLQCIPEAGPGRPIPPPNQGMADTLDEAKAAFAKRYEEVKRGNDGPRRPREFRAMIVPPLTREQCEALELLASGRYGINEEMVFGERGRSFQSLLLCRRRNARR